MIAEGKVYHMRKIPVLIVLAGLMLAAVATGDIIYKRNGTKLVGKVTEKGDKYIIKMPNGISFPVNKADVIHVAYGVGTTMPASAPATPADNHRPINPSVSSVRRWNINEATLPEPIVFMLSRQIELLGKSATDTMRKQSRQWKIVAHDGKRKLGQGWLTRTQQRQRRTSFEKRLRQGDKFAQQAKRLSDRTASDRSKKRKLLTNARREYTAAVSALPDTLMRNFFTAVLDMRKRSYKKAERGFARCIRAEPLVAAFHQGRGIALSKLDRPLDALAEFVICLELRDDTYDTIQLIEAAMKNVPGAKLGDKTYLKAQDLLDRYEKATSTRRTRNTSITWLMPGSDWQKKSYHRPGSDRSNKQQPDTHFAPFLPPYDRIISKQAIAIPISETSLLVDKDAIVGAGIIYVQIAPNKIVRAWKGRSSKARTSSRSKRGKRPELPLAIIHTDGVTFTPVNIEKIKPLKTDQVVTIRATNLYRQMGTEIRLGQATVTQATKPATRPSSQQDSVTLSKSALLPGETIGAVMVDGVFSGLLTSRTKPQENGCGKSDFITPTDLSAWIEPIKRSLGRKRPTSSRKPRIKEDAPKETATGNVFLVHIIIGEKPPTSEVIGN